MEIAHAAGGWVLVALVLLIVLSKVFASVNVSAGVR